MDHNILYMFLRGVYSTDPHTYTHYTNNLIYVALGYIIQCKVKSALLIKTSNLSKIKEDFG